MTSTIAAAEIELPDHFQPAFIIAANLDVAGAAEGINYALSRDYTHAGRLEDDAKIEVLAQSIDARSALLCAFDRKSAVPVALVERYIKNATDIVRCDLEDTVARNRNDLAPAAVEAGPGTLRALVAWADDNGFRREEMAAS